MPIIWKVPPCGAWTPSTWRQPWSATYTCSNALEFSLGVCAVSSPHPTTQQQLQAHLLQSHRFMGNKRGARIWVHRNSDFAATISSFIVSPSVAIVALLLLYGARISAAAINAARGLPDPSL